MRGGGGEKHEPLIAPVLAGTVAEGLAVFVTFAMPHACRPGSVLRVLKISLNESGHGRLVMFNVTDCLGRNAAMTKSEGSPGYTSDRIRRGTGGHPGRHAEMLEDRDDEALGINQVPVDVAATAVVISKPVCPGQSGEGNFASLPDGILRMAGVSLSFFSASTHRP